MQVIVLKDTANEADLRSAPQGSPLNVIYSKLMHGNPKAFVGSLNEAIVRILEDKGRVLYYGSGLPLAPRRDVQVLIFLWMRHSVPNPIFIVVFYQLGF